MEVRNKKSMSSSLTPMRMHGGTGEACPNFSIFAESTCSSCSTPMRMHGGTGGACPIFSPFRHSSCTFTTTAMMTVLWGAVEIFCRINHPSKHYPMSNYSRGRYRNKCAEFPEKFRNYSIWLKNTGPQLRDLYYDSP